MSNTQMPPATPRYLTPEEAARHLNRTCSVHAFRCWAKANHIPVSRVGRFLRYDAAQLDRFMRVCEETPTALYAVPSRRHA